MKRLLKVLLVGVLVLTLTACGGNNTDSNTGNTDTNNNTNTSTNANTNNAKLYKDGLSLINAERTKKGLASLDWDTNLESPVLTRVQELTEYHSNTRPDGTKWTSVLDKNVKNNATCGGELIREAKNFEEALQWWITDDFSYHTMTDKDAKYIAIAECNGWYECIILGY